MPIFMQTLIYVSSAGLALVGLYSYLHSKNLRRLVLHLFILLAVLVLIYLLFIKPEAPSARGGEANDVYFVIVLYLCMLLGMLAHYVYTRLEQPKAQRQKFDWGPFLAPVFASPMIFIPLLSALQNANIDLRQLTSTKLMVFFVAFENGFFWKEYFDHRRQMKREGKDAR